MDNGLKLVLKIVLKMDSVKWENVSVKLDILVKTVVKNVMVYIFLN